MSIPSYTVNPQPAQDSIVEYLKAQYPHVPIIPDGLMDTEDDVIQKFDDQSIKPFVVLWFTTPKRTGRGRSFATHKLDSRKGSVDVVVVARSGTEARELLNDMYDRMIDFQTDGGGRVADSDSLWGAARMLDMQNRPTRWVVTFRLDFGVGSRKTTP